jgi:PAS domain S-box-containing protein
VTSSTGYLADLDQLDNFVSESIELNSYTENQMSSILNKLLPILAIRRKEYLTIDRDFNILETSMGVQRFAESPEEVTKGKDVRLGFPELLGLEDILIDILEGRQTSFEMQAIARSSTQGTPIYVDLCAVRNHYDEESSNYLIIFFEEVTQRMILEQNLVQSSNEKSLLLSALTASNAYIEKIIISMADALIVTTPSGIIKTINSATQHLLGYSKEELIGQPISLITRDHKVLLAATQPPLLFQEALNVVEVVCQTKTGEKLAIAFSCSAIQTDVEGVQNYIYVGRDVTERQRAQRRLAVQYATGRIMSESATPSEAIPKILQAIGENLVWDLGEFWTVESQNPNPQLRCVETWVRPSLSMPEFIETSTHLTLAPSVGLAGHVWALAQQADKLFASGYWSSDVVEDTHFLRSKQASLAGLQGAFAVPIQSDGEVLGVITFFSREKQPRDEFLLQVMLGIGSQLGQFIKRKQAEVALAESEERYRDLFENATDLIQSCALNGQFLYVNRAWRETLGYSEAEVQAMNLFHILHPECKADCLKNLSRVILGEKIDQVKAAFISKDGQKISVEGNINCKFVAGKPVATRAIFRDITERLQAEAALRHQQQQTERLLLNILPEPIADRLKQDTRTIAEDFAEVSVMFADIVGFTQIASHLSPIELIGLLNQVFSAFDHLSEKHGLEKIKTVGDAYMVVGGLPVRRDDHAVAIAEMALDIQAAIAQFRQDTGKEFNIRIGINTGPVVAGVIGIKKFSYDLWGDTVNIASRMESHGVAGHIQVTAATYERLREQYLFEKRGAIQVKGKGEMTTYFLIGRKDEGKAI